MPYSLSENAFAGRTVVLIGGGSGIGFAVARLVTAAGGHIVLGGRTSATLRDAAAQLGDGAAWGVVDTSDPASIDEFFAPGTVDGALWARRDAEARDAAFAFYRADTVLRRLNTDDEIAETVGYLLLNPATTGSTLFPDGGYTFH